MSTIHRFVNIISSVCQNDVKWFDFMYFPDFPCYSLSIRMPWRFYNTEIFRSLTSGKTYYLLYNYSVGMRNTCSVIHLINGSCLDDLKRTKERIWWICSVRYCPWFLWVTFSPLHPVLPVLVPNNEKLLPSVQRRPDLPYGQRQTMSVLDLGTQVAPFLHGLLSQVANWHCLPEYSLGQSQNQVSLSLRREKQL